MNVLVIGSGGREHAIAHAVSKSKHCSSLTVIPGNPGIAKIAKCVNINPMNNDLIKEYCAKEEIELIIPGSEVYLKNGIANAFEDTNVTVFGPSKEAAEIETSKQFAKAFMKRHSIPTSDYAVFDSYTEALKYVQLKGTPIVIKYDGLAGGKGVVVAMDEKEANEALTLMLKEKKYGDDSVVIEEYLEGPEFSFMCFVHNDTVIPMPISQDHKRLLENDKGPNTGGMGIYSGVPIIPDEVVDVAYQTIMSETAKGLVSEGRSFTGFLYGGLMLTKEGPKVIEFNARFGDPETEVLLPRLNTDFLDVISSILQSKEVKVEWDKDYYLGVVLASKGYPNSYEKGFKIEGLEEIEGNVYHMGTSTKDNDYITNGGRVLLVYGKGDTLEKAYKEAYKNVGKIKCDNLVYRTDIGYKTLKG
jgi:phosphoribosylamine--glycine ligase